MNWIEDETIDPSDAASERARLVRLCARLTGDPDVAEDLAQETLFEAWRHAHKLYDLAGRERWLAMIARNVCLRWTRRHWRAAAYYVQLDPNEEPADTFDIEIEVERPELVELLDRALSLLPAVTRQVLVERYIHELPYSAIADQLGVSEDAVAMRLTRGKLLLRRIPTTDLKDATLLYNSSAETSNAWQATRVWCLHCGQHRLLARLPNASSTIAFRCPACSPDPDVPDSEFPLTNTSFAQLIGNLMRPQVILGRTAAWVHTYFRPALAARAAQCTHCNQPVDVHVVQSGDVSTLQQHPHFLYVACAACGTAVSTSFRGLVTSTPEVQLFWRNHTRIRMLPEYEVEIAGQAAIVTRFESVTSADQLDVVSMRDAWHVPSVYQTIKTTRR